MTDTKRGILVLCLGHPYFGRMGHQLAVSIRQIEPDIPIALVWAGHALDHLTVFLLSDTFDFVIEAPKESYTKNGNTEWIKSKTYLYDFSPFEETIFIDADTILTGYHKPSEMFAELEPFDFTVQNRGCEAIVKARDSYSTWANTSEVREKYGLSDESKFYRVYSEFIYFKKTERIKELFEQHKYNYDNLQVPVRIAGRNGGKEINEFSGGIPDELPLAIAMMQKSVYPHSDNFIPIYWQTMEKKIPQDLKNYFALSAGGKISGEWTKKHYDRLVQSYFNSAGLHNTTWKLQNKRRFLPERSTI